MRLRVPSRCCPCPGHVEVDARRIVALGTAWRAAIVVTGLLLGRVACAQGATLIHSYSFDDGTVTDLAGTANGTLSGGATIANGQLALDGANGFVQFGTRLVPTSGSFSVALFAQATAVSGYAELISQGQSLGPGFYIGHDSARNFRLGDNLLTTNIPFPTDGMLHHYALTVDGTNTRFYIDGVLAATFPAISVAAAGDNTRLGKQFSPFAEYFSGRLDDVRIYSGALSATQVAALRSENNTVAAGSRSFAADHVSNSARGITSSLLAYGGQGTATDASWSGKIVILDRGTGTFHTKVRNVQLSGGLACIIANNVPGNFSGSLGDGNFTTIAAVSVSQEDGVVLKSLVNTNVTVTTLVGRNAPTIVVQPQSQVLPVGANVVLSVVATGAPPLSYQWRIDGTPVPDPAFAGSTITFTPQAAATVRWTVVVSNAAGSVTSSEAVLTITGAGSSPAIVAQPQSRVVNVGDAATLAVTASGAGLAYQWQLNGANIPGGTGATLAIARLQPGAIGDYTVVVGNSAGSVTSSAATLSLLAGRLANLSVLSPVAPGDPLTVGTVIGGRNANGALPLLIRGAGPSLGALGVASPNPDPKLEVFSGTSVVATNDNWGGTADLNALIGRLGAFPFAGASSRDAATIFEPAITTTPASYTVQVTGTADAGGPVIAEVYDGVPKASVTTTTPRLINLSVLKQVPADGLLTAGFVIGTGTPKQVLIRAVGPTLGLSPFNVGGVMPNPAITLFGQGGVALAVNDDWGGDTALAAAFAHAGAFVLPANSRDAALLVTLEPGNYTVQVAASAASGAPAGGVVLVEVYDLDAGALPAAVALPATVTALSGSTTILSVNASGAIGYQWQRLPAGSSSWVNVSDGDGFAGSTTASLLASGSAVRSGDQFRVAVTNSAGAIRSTPVSITVATAPTAIAVAGFSAPTAPPLGLIAIPVAGLSPDATTFVEFLDSAGALVAQVPPVAVTATSVSVAVPPLFGSDGTSLVGGTLSARIVQLIGTMALKSNTFVAAQVQAVPGARLAPGTLTLAVLQAGVEQASGLLASVNGTDRDALSATIESLQRWIGAVQSAMASGSGTYSLGSGTTTVSLALTTSQLQAMDNLLVANLRAIGGMTAAMSVRASDEGRRPGVAAAIDPVRIATTNLWEASVNASGAGVVATAARQFVTALSQLSPGDTQVLAQVHAGAYGLLAMAMKLSGLTIAAGAIDLVATPVLVAGIAGYAVWHGISNLMDASYMVLNPNAAAERDARNRSYELLDAIAARGVGSGNAAAFVSEVNARGTRGTSEIFSGPTTAVGDFLRLASHVRHGATGSIESTHGAYYTRTVADSAHFNTPALDGSDPTEQFLLGRTRYIHFATPFTLRAVPNGPAVFTGWRVRAPFYGSVNYQSAGRDPILLLQMVRGGWFVIATFDHAHALRVNGSPATGGTIDVAPAAARYPSATGSSPPSYLRGARVTLTARENTGFTFASWSGLEPANGDASNGKTATVVMTADRSVTANFSSGTPAPTLPAAPTNLTATAGNRQVSLSWTASPGATSYQVKLGAASGGAYVTVATVTSTSYMHTELANGIVHYYIVTALNGAGESGRSNEVSATPTAGGGGSVSQYDGSYTGRASTTSRNGFPLSREVNFTISNGVVSGQQGTRGTVTGSGAITFTHTDAGFYVGTLALDGTGVMRASGTFTGAIFTSGDGPIYSGSWTGYRYAR